MSSDIQKYNNWKAITESDYVTMFIKTWFAFVSTLRELYPKKSIEDIIGKGDNVFINPFLNDFKDKYSTYNKLQPILRYILTVYQYGREYVLKNKRYIRFFVEDFYATNQAFVYKETIENEVECTIRKAAGQKIVLHVKYLDSKYEKDKKPLIIDVKIHFDGLLSNDTVEKLKDEFIDDETSFIEYFAKELSKKASKKFLDEFAQIDLSYLSKKDLQYIEGLTSQSINAIIEKSIMQMTDYSLQKDQYLLSQSPCPNFIYKVKNNEEIDKNETYVWFIKFVYFLRNALFHEIIDPLESFWQNLFKNAYLALKEILDGNIAYLNEK